MTDLIMMVGIAGSGKSTVAKKISDEMVEAGKNTVIVETDTIRRVFFDGEQTPEVSAKVFEKAHEMINDLLGKNINVIFDATNLSRKRRTHFLNNILKHDVNTTAVYVHADYKTIIEQNANRPKEDFVPIGVIDNMYKSLQIPIKNEGFDYVEYHINENIQDFPDQVKMSIRAHVIFNRTKENIIGELAQFFNEFGEINGLSHDSKWHNLSVGLHTYYVYEYIFNNFGENENVVDHEKMLWVALLHDLGKAFTKSFYNYKGEKKRYASFLRHENVSAQIAVTILSQMGFSRSFIKEAVKLIEYHMYLLNDNPNIEKLSRFLSPREIELLKILRDADNYAH